MAREPDGRERLATLALPLPMDVAAALMKAIAECAERLGYTDVVIRGGGHEIVGKPPARSDRG